MKLLDPSADQGDTVHGTEGGHFSGGLLSERLGALSRGEWLCYFRAVVIKLCDSRFRGVRRHRVVRLARANSTCYIPEGARAFIKL